MKIKTFPDHIFTLVISASQDLIYSGKKYQICILLAIFSSFHLFAQKKILVEKIGTNRKYYYETGNDLKLKIKPFDSILRGELSDIRDSALTLSGYYIRDLMLKDVASVYKQFAFPKKFAVYSAIFSGFIFSVIVTNHLINNEQVFTSDLFIITGAFIGVSLVSLSFSQKQCKIGSRWKLKVIDFSFPK
jgi:hypothetical protein